MMNNSPKSEVRCPKSRTKKRRRAAKLALLGILLLGFMFAGNTAAPQSATSDFGPRTWDSSAWREAEAGYEYSFPRDHASHPEYGIEWWYYTGNIETKEGRRFGYQLTFFRIGVAPAPSNPSRWALRDLYVAHFAISDVERQSFHSFERMNRAAVGWAGAATDAYRVWNEDWEARLDAGIHLLKASEEGFQIDFRLEPAKAEVIHGENDISQKGPSAGNASHYYSLTRLRTSGQMTVGGQRFEVTGLSWMDHEFGTSFLEEQQVGWDWFSIQLDDGRELMLFQLRSRDGSIDPRSSGTLVEAGGRAIKIPNGEFSLTEGETWLSAESGASYPVAWTIDLPRFGLRLKVNAAMKDQELRTIESTNVTYWEGSINVEGQSGEKKIAGRGYLEMTGYAGKSMGSIMH